ncbi:flagellin [Paenibacillus albiflavus]|uniref:Flagellin n=1 Tax=Paenibacillus albiflavus TaxID=2545760 RepID=A0A4R4EAG3_9BACL|nr:flagellin [Paenibacillus albiflavus]TCZ76846.1 flagellin [Paenibacillus albiflavus]
MIINHNLNAMNTHRAMGNNTLQSGKNMEKLSSGLRINRAADDAAGLSISEKMRGQIRGLDQAQRNAQDGISLVQTAEGAMTEISDMLVRMKELHVQRANGTYNGNDKANIDAELTALTSEIDSITTRTTFNGIDVFDASKTVDIQIDDAAEKLTITLPAKTSIVPATGATLGDINTLIDTVSTQRANLGAIQNRLEHTVNNLGATSENLQASESRIRDTDMAKEMVQLSKNNILLQASQAMLAQANQNPQGVLQLLR